MGCPDKGVEKQGAGAGLIKNPKLAQEIILAAMRGATSEAKTIPVSVKTRIGYNKNELETWLPAILETKPAVVTVHARTRKEMSLVPARWEHVKRAVEIRNELSPETLIFGNGDVKDVAHGIALCNETGADGAMLGRAIFGNPWLFSPRPGLGVEERLRVLIEHTKLFEEIIGPKPPVGCGKNFSVMKKHFKAYVTWATEYSQFSHRPKSGVPDRPSAKELRVELMETENAEQVEGIIERFLKTL